MYVIKAINNNTAVTIPKILAGVSVPKKKFKKATDRNTIKRKINEIFRLHKPQLYHVIAAGYQIQLFFIYVHVEIMPYEKLNRKMEQLFVNLTTAWQKETATTA